MRKDNTMRGLVFDVNVLVYIHDLLFIINRDSQFVHTKTFRQIFEANTITILKYLQKTIYVILSFILVVFFMKVIGVSDLELKYFYYLIVSAIYGILLISCKEDIVSLRYQLKAKKAVQYAVLNYNYKQYVLFLDKYLSEESTKNYIKERI